MKEFLRVHGVEYNLPVQESSLSRALGGTIAGGLGILAGAEVHFEKQLQQNSAKPEWISWKQWALSHADWNE